MARTFQKIAASVISELIRRSGLTQPKALNLAGLCFGQLLDKCHRARVFVRGDGTPIGTYLLERHLPDATDP